MKRFFLLIISFFLLLGCSKEDFSYENKFIEPSVWSGGTIKVEFSPNKTLTITKRGKVTRYNYVFIREYLIDAFNLSTGGHSIFELYRDDIYMKFGNPTFGYCNLTKLE